MRGVFAKGFDFSDFDGGGAVELFFESADVGAYFGDVVAGFEFVEVLEGKVVYGLGFHVGDAAWEGEEAVDLVEGGDGVGDEPEVGRLGVWGSVEAFGVGAIVERTWAVGFWQKGDSTTSRRPLDMEGGFRLFRTAPTASS